MQEKPVCPKCGSSEIQFDSSAIWNPDLSGFEVVHVSDRAESCGNCGNEHFYAEWVKEENK